MSEDELIHNTPEPRTRESLARDLRGLGLEPGMTVIMHSSLRSLGWVSGGPVAVVQALMDVVTEAGMIVVPTHSSNYSDPAKWVNPPVPQAWWQVIYDTMPIFDPQTTPTYFMGRIVEVFRTFPGVIRSTHPTDSFAAWGKYAHFIIDNHSLEYSLGEQSPLARIYDLNGWILLLGVGYDRNTSFHLAEYRAPNARTVSLGVPLLERGQRVWKNYLDIDIDASIFPEIGVAFEKTGLVRISMVGSAVSKLFPQRAGVDFAQEWITYKRTH